MASALAPDGEHVEHVEEPPALLAVPGGEVQPGIKWAATAAKIIKVRKKFEVLTGFELIFFRSSPSFSSSVFCSPVRLLLRAPHFS